MVELFPFFRHRHVEKEQAYLLLSCVELYPNGNLTYTLWDDPSLEASIWLGAECFINTFSSYFSERHMHILSKTVTSFQSFFLCSDGGNAQKVCLYTYLT